MSLIQEGFVLQVVHGRKADGPYYHDDGEWGTFEGAQIYYSRKAMRSGLAEARKALPEDGVKVVAFGVYV